MEKAHLNLEDEIFGMMIVIADNCKFDQKGIHYPEIIEIC